jgi:hypothetical protein
VFLWPHTRTGAGGCSGTGLAIACFGPGDPKATEEANAKHDRLEFDMLGCFPVMMNIPVKRIEEKKAASGM